ncbi:hypothetical protein SELMODRAFT_420401 [Selaginella moellendorffii]|uniref:Pentacotripeptide-repeat region of PRORP domain-containing protein n=1 Tax=Selaginella moellendorffii TaxID=88036 RepID=D8SBW2_SELML|nr:hypothetical protein SELMODRAFT_420401 [Selaginella moellendorffii]
MACHDILSWNGLLGALVRDGRFTEALKLFQEMPERDVASYNFAIAAVSQGEDLSEARTIFERMPERDLFSWTTLLNALAATGRLTQGRALFNQMPALDIVAWSSMTEAYARAGHTLKAMAIEFNSVSNELMLGGLIISMYGGCGDLTAAANEFHALLLPYHGSPVLWSTMVAAYSQNGLVELAMVLFSTMFGEGVEPSDLTFVTILAACSHGGRLHEGLYYFRVMCTDCGIAPGVQHYHCLIDLLGRSGRLEEARELVTSCADPGAWTILLGKCKLHGNARLGKVATTNLDHHVPGPYLLLANAYTLR